MTFVILALPRCRTAWMAHFLSYPCAVDGRPRRCGHDIAIECAMPDDFFGRLGGMDGTAETAAVLGWKLLRARRPDIKIVAVTRPVDEIHASLAACGVTPLAGEIETRAAMLHDMIESDAAVRSLTFADLASIHVAKWLFEYCLELSFDRGWWQALDGINIQVNMQQRLDKLNRHRSDIEDLKRRVAEETADDPGRAIRGHLAGGQCAGARALS